MSLFLITTRIILATVFTTIVCGETALASDSLFLKMKQKNEQDSAANDACLRFSSKSAEREFRYMILDHNIDGINSEIYKTHICGKWHQGKLVTIHEGITGDTLTKKVPASVDGCRFTITVSENRDKKTFNVQTTYGQNCDKSTTTARYVRKWRVASSKRETASVTYSIANEDGKFCGIIILKDDPAFSTLPYQTGYGEYFSSLDEAAISLCSK